MNPYKILLIEDDEVDIIAAKKSFKNVGVQDLLVATNSEEALKILKDLSGPIIILLDLNLPEIDGFEILKYFKANNELKHIPIIIMTSSNNEDDILKAYRNYASGYITKPIDAKKLTEKIIALEKYWSACEI